MKFMKKNGGFTLVELIVVIAILAILAAIAVPAYSGYISKANEAADQQLLAAVNTAYAAACLENNEDMMTISSYPSIPLKGDPGAKTINFAGVAPYGKSFETYFGGNTASVFKTFNSIVFDSAKGVFVDGASENITVSLKGKQFTVSGEKIQTLVNSNLGAMGAETLLTEVNDVVSWAAFETDILDTYAGETFAKAMASYLGVPEGLEGEAFDEAYNKAVADLAGEDGDSNAIIANGVVLYAAQNSKDITSQNLVDNWLSGDKTTDNMTSSASASTLSEAAAIYGLYMSYKGDEFDSDAGALSVMEGALKDGDFAEWVSGTEGQKELDAYLAAMDTIDSAAQGDATTSILKSGFSDPELIAMMESLMGN